MKTFNTIQKQRLTDKLQSLENGIVDEVTSRFFRQQSLIKGYGANGRTECANDARYHLTFLRTAIEFGSQETFAHYLGWTAHVLQSRNIPSHHLREFLKDIFHAIEPHLQASERELLQSFLLEIPVEVPSATSQSAGSPGSPLHRSKEVFLQALLSGNRHVAKTVAMEALRNGFTLQDIYVEVFQNALYQIGALWESNQITVAQEHVGTAITQYAIAQMYSTLTPKTAHKGKGIVTGVEGELHQVGAHMVADILEMEGWDIRFLGVNVPHKAIIQMITEFQPDLIGISATMVLNIPTVKNLISEIRSDGAGSGASRILVGGSAFRSLPTVYREIGADGFAPDLTTLRAVI